MAVARLSQVCALEFPRRQMSDELNRTTYPHRVAGSPDIRYVTLIYAGGGETTVDHDEGSEWYVNCGGE